MLVAEEGDPKKFSGPLNTIPCQAAYARATIQLSAKSNLHAAQQLPNVPPSVLSKHSPKSTKSDLTPKVCRRPLAQKNSYPPPLPIPLVHGTVRLPRSTFFANGILTSENRQPAKPPSVPPVRSPIHRHDRCRLLFPHSCYRPPVRET